MKPGTSWIARGHLDHQPLHGPVLRAPRAAAVHRHRRQRRRADAAQGDRRRRDRLRRRHHGLHRHPARRLQGHPVLALRRGAGGLRRLRPGHRPLRDHARLVLFGGGAETLEALRPMARGGGRRWWCSRCWPSSSSSRRPASSPTRGSRPSGSCAKPIVRRRATSCCGLAAPLVLMLLLLPRPGRRRRGRGPGRRRRRRGPRPDRRPDPAPGGAGLRRPAHAQHRRLRVPPHRAAEGPQGRHRPAAAAVESSVSAPSAP